MRCAQKAFISSLSVSLSEPLTLPFYTVHNRKIGEVYMSRTEFIWRAAEEMSFDELEAEWWELEKRLATIKSVLEPMRAERMSEIVLKIVGADAREYEEKYGSLHFDE